MNTAKRYVIVKNYVAVVQKIKLSLTFPFEVKILFIKICFCYIPFHIVLKSL